MFDMGAKPAPLVEARGLARNFPGRQGLLGRVRDVWAVRDVTLALAPGETVGVVGESGCGKSTLGRMMMGLDRPTEGRVSFDGRDLAALSAAERRKLSRRMQMVFQDPFGSLDPRRSIGAQITDGLRIHRLVPPGEIEDELFRLGRIVAANPQLEQAMSDLGKPVQAKRELLGRLLYGKVTAVTEALAIQTVSRLRRSAPADALDELAGLAASVRDRAVAHVRSAAPLSDRQLEKLTATLTRTYGKPVTVHIEVDTELLSGLVVRVGDEVIDGSGAGRLAALRKTLK